MPSTIKYKQLMNVFQDVPIKEAGSKMAYVYHNNIM